MSDGRSALAVLGHIQSVRQISADSDVRQTNAFIISYKYKLHPQTVQLAHELKYYNLDRRQQFWSSLSTITQFSYTTFAEL